MIGVHLTASARYLPPDVMSNEQLVERLGLEVDGAWIESRTGIRQRHWMPEGMTTSDMVVEVARDLLAQRGLTPADVDRLVLSTVSPDHPSPATAVIAARKLGARCPAYDLSAACAGFLYGLEAGAAAVRSGERHVLVIAADARSRFIDRRERRGAVLFSDGAAGVLLEPGEAGAGLLAVHVGAEGREDLGAWVPAGGASRPTTPETVAAGEHFLHVDPLKDIFSVFTGYVREAAEAVLAKAGATLDDVDLFITHQGNEFLVRRILEDLGLPEERAVVDVAPHGNTSGATVPIALAEAQASGRIRSGDRVLLVSVGAGYVFGAALVRFP